MNLKFYTWLLFIQVFRIRNKWRIKQNNPPENIRFMIDNPGIIIRPEIYFKL